MANPNGCDTLRFVFVADSGHGWLAVPIDYIAQLGIKEQISGYSYFDLTTNMGYLEEDCDAGRFIDAAKARGWTMEFVEDYHDGLCFVRGFPSWPWAGLSPHGSTRAVASL